jgi:hypothetical protein
MHRPARLHGAALGALHKTCELYLVPLPLYVRALQPACARQGRREKTDASDQIHGCSVPRCWLASTTRIGAFSGFFPACREHTNPQRKKALPRSRLHSICIGYLQQTPRPTAQACCIAPCQPALSGLCVAVCLSVCLSPACLSVTSAISVCHVCQPCLSVCLPVCPSVRLHARLLLAVRLQCDASPNFHVHTYIHTYAHARAGLPLRATPMPDEDPSKWRPVAHAASRTQMNSSIRMHRRTRSTVSTPPSLHPP